MLLGAPVYKLDHAILWEIFLIIAAKNTPKPSSIDDMPLIIIHRASQVCKDWRDILLGSSSIWGKCMELKLLNQISNHWRDLILERTGQSQLTVTGFEDSRDRPKSGLVEFTLNLLDKHWLRIQELSLSLTCSTSDNIRIWSTFSHPTDNLKIFSVRLWNNDLGWGWGRAKEVLPNFQLFSGHAPALRLCHIRIHFHAQVLNRLNTESLSICNLLDLDLFLPLCLKCWDLLNVLAHMPLLEKLRIHAVEIIRNKADELASRRPYMPHLRKLSVICPDLDIYPALLDHITPSGGYAFYLIHKLPDWSGLAIQTRLEKTGYLQRALKSYADSFFNHGEHESHSDEMQLHASERRLVFRCWDCVVEVEIESTV